MPLAAAAETRARVDVSAGATAASNPYLLNAPDTEAVGASLTIDPMVFFEDGNSAITFNGSLTLEKLSEDYGTDESVSLGASGVFRVDERTTFSTDVGFRTSESAARRFFGGMDLEGLEPGEFPDSPYLDPTLGNIMGRTSRLDVNASVERLVGPNSVLTAKTGLGLTEVDAGSGQDYKDATFALTYSRRMTERTSLRTTFDAGYVDYLGQRSGDGVFVTGLAGVDHQVSQSLHLSAQLGASFAATESPSGGRRTTVSWAGEFDLCNTYPRGMLCATASRSAQPTSLGGLTNVSSIGVSYTHAFGASATASATANYARTSDRQPGFALPGGKSELAGVSASYRHKLGERISAFATPSFTSVADDLSDRRENYQVMLGISYRLGSLQ
jgi:hypothetical protein